MKTAEDYLSDVGIGDPTPALIEMADSIIGGVRDELDSDPTFDDYAGGVTEIADRYASDLDISDIAGSTDALTFEHQFGEQGSLQANVSMTIYEIATTVANLCAEGERPAADDLKWSQVPIISHGDVLIGRSEDDGFIYVEVKVQTTENEHTRLSITGHGTAGSAGQIGMHIDATAIEPAPSYTREDIARLFEIWDRWHLNDMSAGCEHQRAGAEAWGLPMHKAWEVGEHCPVCDYRYGHEWISERVPADVLAFVARFTTVSGVTPAPSGRCPFEADHASDDDEPCPETGDVVVNAATLRRVLDNASTPGADLYALYDALEDQGH